MPWYTPCQTMVAMLAASFRRVALGYDPSVTTTANFEGMSRFEWDGEIGYGLTVTLPAPGVGLTGDRPSAAG